MENKKKQLKERFIAFSDSEKWDLVLLFSEKVKALRLENTVLKDKLEIAESQIEDLKSQVAYCENP